MKFLLLFLPLLFFAPGVIIAHGGPGVSFTATTTEGYLVDVDYSNPAFVAGTSGSFNMNFFTDVNRQVPIAFDNAWVRIIKTNDDTPTTLFAGDITHLYYAPTTFAYVFSEPGEYAINVRYNRSNGGTLDQSLAEAEFPFTVARAESKSFETGGTFVGILIGVVGAALVFALAKKQKLLA